jgi:hypothetical protein
MSSPIFPVILIIDGISLKISNGEKEMSKVRFLDLEEPPDDQLAYDSQGMMWAFYHEAPPLKNRFWNMVRNPLVEARIEWTPVITFDLNHLKSKINFCLDKDHDILTEHEEADFLKLKILDCNSFSEILTVLNKYVFEVNEAELWREQESR